MRITSSINPLPLNIAKAYGLNPAAAARSTGGATSPIASIAPARKPDAYRPEAPAQSLVAAKVSQPVHFESAAPTRSAEHILPMYTRAADKMEAAIAVHVGRTLDVTG